MTVISRALPQSNSGRRNALNNLKSGIDGAPAGTVVLPPDVTTDLPLLRTGYNTKSLAVETAEAIALQFISYKNRDFLCLSTVTLDFLKVVRITVNRSLVFGNGVWEQSDLNYYNLDETGYNLPTLRTEEEIRTWAESVINGESSRLIAKPTASGMTNPLASEVSAQLVIAEASRDEVAAKNQELAQARNQVNLVNPQVDVFIKRAWDFLEANFSSMEAPARRNVLRQFGVVFITRGIPNNLTFTVKDTAGNTLAGTLAFIEQSGAEASANEDGRVLLTTNVVGPIIIVLQYPGKQKQEVTFEIPEDAEDQTFELPDVVMQDNV